MMLGYELDISNGELMAMVKDPQKFYDYLQSVMAEQSQEEHVAENDIKWGRLILTIRFLKWTRLSCLPDCFLRMSKRYD
ncbi:hypothetical protein AB4210_014790 [Vibrio cyclitrophicus]|uniref:hypothetical protein n=1 Tax=Vibrio cyclitrophicus TaxID=47951 RepID=UPI0002D353C3|nr:hypothetical protein [Vibrio cyclitrophicus]